MKIGRNSNLSALSKGHLLRFVFVRAKKKKLRLRTDLLVLFAMFRVFLSYTHRALLRDISFVFIVLPKQEGGARRLTSLARKSVWTALVAMPKTSFLFRNLRIRGGIATSDY